MIMTCPGYDEQSATGNCNFRGECVGTTSPPSCVCNEGWSGLDCAIGKFLVQTNLFSFETKIALKCVNRILRGIQLSALETAMDMEFAL